MGAQIKAIAYHFPETCLTNDDLRQEFLNYDFSKFEKKVGIVNRYVVSGNTTALDLAEQACHKLYGEVLIGFLLGREARWITGQSFIVDGGYSIK